MAGSALMPSVASAEFRYVAPPAARAGVTVLDEAADRGERNGATLAQTLKRLAPPSLRLRYDRRVDAARAVMDAYPDWQSLLFGEGLAAVRRGGELHIRPAGLPPGAVELATPIAAMACGASKPATPCGPCWSAGARGPESKFCFSPTGATACTAARRSKAPSSTPCGPCSSRFLICRTRPPGNSRPVASRSR